MKLFKIILLLAFLLSTELYSFSSNLIQTYAIEHSEKPNCSDNNFSSEIDYSDDDQFYNTLGFYTIKQNIQNKRISKAYSLLSHFQNSIWQPPIIF